MLVDPFAPRTKIRRAALVSNRVQCPDPNLVVHRYINETNLAGVLVLVPKADMTPLTLLGHVTEVG